MTTFTLLTVSILFVTTIMAAVVPVKDCSTVSCAKGQSCENGVCKKAIVQENLSDLSKITLCPTINSLKPIACGDQRPTEGDCPKMSFYYVTPEPQACGVTSKGAKINFQKSCLACMDQRVQYYFEKPCYETNFICEAGEKCVSQYCQGHKCKANQDCPYDWQICSSDSLCVDQCMALGCPDCKYGVCNYQKPSGMCIFDSDCDSSWSCVGYQCVDMCLTTSCPAGSKCFNGVCVA